MTNKFAPTYRSLESSNYFFGSYMTNGRQRVNVENKKSLRVDRQVGRKLCNNISFRSRKST